MEEIIEKCEESMNSRMERLEKELLRVRTGRASTNLIEGIRVEYYGTPTPLEQVASLSTPDARTILISPYEKKLLAQIEKSIHLANIGIQPTNDGNVIRLPIPPLNESRRKEIAKSIQKIGEDSKVSIRKVRQESNVKIKKQEKDKLISKDESQELQKEIQKLTDSYIQKIGERVTKKESEVLSI